MKCTVPIPTVHAKNPTDDGDAANVRMGKTDCGIILQSRAVSNEISGVQEQNFKCASVHFGKPITSVTKCAHKF